jgi:hypothetical protein
MHKALPYHQDHPLTIPSGADNLILPAIYNQDLPRQANVNYPSDSVQSFLPATKVISQGSLNPVAPWPDWPTTFSTQPTWTDPWTGLSTPKLTYLVNHMSEQNVMLNFNHFLDTKTVAEDVQLENGNLLTLSD